MTMGTMPSPWVSSALMNRSCSVGWSTCRGRLWDGKCRPSAGRPARSDSVDRGEASARHQLVERHVLRRCLGALEDVRGHVVLDDDRLDLGHPVAVAQVPAHHLAGLLVALRELLDVRLQLLGLGLQVVRAHELGNHQPETDAPLCLRLEHLTGDRRGFGILDAALLQVGAHLLDHSLGFAGDQRLRHLELGRLDERVHHARLVARLDAELDLALEVLANVGAQGLDRAAGDAERLGQRLVDGRQVLGLDLLQRDGEVGFLAGDVLALVVGRELKGKGLRVAGLHAAHGVVELLEHLPFADHELEALGLAAVERNAVDGAGEIDRDAVAGRCTLARRALLEGAPLLPEDVDRLVDRLLGDLGGDALDLRLREIAELDLGIDLEGRVEGDLALWGFRLLGDPRRPGDAQLGLVDRLREDLADLVVQHLAVHRVAVALRDDAHRHLAGPKTVGADGARKTAQPRLDLGGDRRRRQREGDAPLELVEGFNLDGHDAFDGSMDSGARGRTRTDTPVKASGPKPGASTNFATRAVTHWDASRKAKGHRTSGTPAAIR